MGTYGIYIIESLAYDDEQNESFDGRVLDQMLDFIGVRSQYRYIRTKAELRREIEFFTESDFKYLHFSCHGSEDGTEVCLTTENLSLEEFASIVGPSTNRRRLFISACKITSFSLAKFFIPRFDCLSIIGSSDEPSHSQSAIFWSTFYYMMGQRDQWGMRQKELLSVLKRLSAVFELRLNYFSIITKKNKRSWNHLAWRKLYNGRAYKTHILETPFINLFRTDSRPPTLE